MAFNGASGQEHSEHYNGCPHACRVRLACCTTHTHAVRAMLCCATGEIHLETCIKDLRERFARVELLVSPPLVAFRCGALWCCAGPCHAMPCRAGCVCRCRVLPGRSVTAWREVRSGDSLANLF